MYTVMLVDDEPSVIEAERRIIESKTEQFEVIAEAYSVDKAIELYKQCHPDVILTDMKMPKKSGIELIKYIAEQEATTTVCVSVSGYTDFDFVHDAFKYGAYDYLLKPVEPDKLKELFRKIYCTLISSRQHVWEAKLPNKKITAEELVELIEKDIRGSLSGDNSIIQICNRFMISQPYLSKIFKKYKNCTYNEYLTNLKIEESKKLLREQKFLVGEVSDALGFSDQFYFSKVFKSIVGCTPREYLKSNQE